jgi:hypothetical protein
LEAAPAGELYHSAPEAFIMWPLIRSLVPVLIALGSVYLFFYVQAGLSDHDYDRMQMIVRSQFALKTAAQVGGLLIAFSALLVLFERATQGGTPSDLLAPGMCVLGGVLMFEPHWAIAVTFGLLAIARVVERLFAGRRADSSSAPAPAARAVDGSGNPA